MRLFVSNIRAMSYVFRGVVEVRILTLNVWERVMTDHMLVNPGIWGAEHEPNIHTQLIKLPVFRVRKVASVMINIHGPSPEGNWECEEGIPVALNISLNLSICNSKEDDTLDYTAPCYFYIST
jgi:hypothetical protein